MTAQSNQVVIEADRSEWPESDWGMTRTVEPGLVSFLLSREIEIPAQDHWSSRTSDLDWMSDRRPRISKALDEVSDTIRLLLGASGQQRLEDFKLISKTEGRSLGLSIAVLEEFGNLFPQLRDLEPSVFLVDGHLELQWEDSAGGTVEVALMENVVEFYIESTDEEGTFDLDSMPTLVNRLMGL
jgi:hypothetical protein